MCLVNRAWPRRFLSHRTIEIRAPFAGELAQLTGGPTIVGAVVRDDTEVYEMSPEALRRLEACWRKSECVD